MALPLKTRTWTISPNNRITFVSLLDTMARYLFGVKEFLKTNGYTVRGSSDGATGAMDTVDRWLTFADADTRGAAAGNPQSWIVLRDGNGVDILLTYQGASDDIARISISVSQLFVAAGTPTHQPTATDERVLTSALTIIGTTASGDRLWNGWVDSTDRLCRFAVVRSGSLVGAAWGVEEVAPVVSGTGVSWSPPVWGFSLQAATSYLNNGTQAGVAKPVIASVNQNPAIVFGAEVYGNNSSFFGAVKPELQGALGYPIWPLSIGSATLGCAGKLGNLYDWWYGRTTGQATGDTYGSLEFIGICTAQGAAASATGLWPWDEATTPILT